MEIRLSAIHHYPVKGIQGVSVTAAQVEAEGLRHDRRWMIVDAQGQFISQRSQPRLALITGHCDGNRLVLSAPGTDPLELSIPDGAQRLEVTVWRDRLEAAAADPRADRWLSGYLDQYSRLAFMDDRCRRPIASSSAQATDTVSFADGYPCLLISRASLEDLNSRLAHPLPMDRFRPNLVVDGCPAFAEDGWRKIAVGDSIFRFAGLCPRCSVTTVDQATGQRNSEEPLTTLLTYRQRENGVVFGVNLIPEQTGSIALGDLVSVLE